MNTFLYDFLKLEDYPNASTRSRAALIYVNVVLMLFFTVIYFVAIPGISEGGESLTVLRYALTRGILTPIPFLFYMLIGFLIVTFVLVRTGRIREGALALIAVWMLGSIGALTSLPSIGTAAISLLNVLVISALILQERGLLMSFAVSIIAVLLAAALRDDQTLVSEDTFIIVTLMTAFAMILYLFLRFFRVSLSEGVSVAVDERIKANELLAEATYLISERAQLTEIARKITRSIIESFDAIYQARVYMLDEAKVEALLVGNTLGTNVGPVQSAERVSVGSLNPLGEASISGQPVIRPLERDQAVDVVLPMKVGTRIVGLLNLRTQRPQYFEQAQVQDIFKSLADSIALILDNVSQFERAEARLRENNQLIERTQEALREVERLNQRLTGSAWTQFLRSGVSIPGLTVDFEEGTQVDGTDWTKSLSEAVMINHLVQEERDDHQVIAVPLRVRGQVIGAMEFELDSRYEFTPEDLELVQDVSERFGLAVENTRLVQESQRVAQREALVNQISAKLQSANDVNVALTEAARGCGMLLRLTVSLSSSVNLPIKVLP
jgi:hypothetical protein